MSRTSDDTTVPRALIHTKILDAAADAPEASMAVIAAEVPSATTELVERVLDEYGDPGADQGEELGADQGEDPGAQSDEVAEPVDSPTEQGESLMEHADRASDPDEPATDTTPTAADDGVPDPDDLSPKQRDVLEAIADHPEGTQREIADRLGVSAPTVSNRANSIPGFDWADRRAFVDAVVDADVADDDRSGDEQDDGTDGDRETDAGEHRETGPMTTNDRELAVAIEQLATRVAGLEETVDELGEADCSPALGEDVELTHKVVHACLESDAITEEEELQILRALLE